MKYLFNYVSNAFVLIILLFIFSCNGINKKITKWDNGRDKAILTFLNPNDTLTYLKEDFYKSGQPFSKGMYVGGKKNGLWDWWYLNGNKKDEATFDTGTYIIQRKHWFENGNLKQVEIITGDSSYGNCDCFDGHVTNYYENGIVKDESIYFNGKRDSEYIFRYDNGQIKKQEYFKADLKEGPYYEWFQNGTKWVEGYFKNDKQDSIWVWFDSTGKPQAEHTFKNGLLVK